MFRKIGAAVSSLGNLQTVLQVLVWLFPGAGAAMTGWVAHIERLGAAWTIFAASGVFCFLSVASIVLVAFSRSTSLLGKFALRQIAVTNIAKIEGMNGLAIAMNGGFLNSADENLYFDLKEASIAIDNKTRQDDEIRTNVTIIPSKGESRIAFPVIGEIGEKQFLEGRLKLTIAYGRKPDQLKRTYKLDANFDLLVQTTADGKYSWNTNLKYNRVEYT